MRVVAARHRRQLRHEVGDLQRGAAGAAGLEDDRPAGEMDEHALGGVPLRRAGARQRHRRRACARQGRHLPRPSASTRSSTPAPICNRASRPTPAISARWPASTGRRRCMWNRPRCSPTPSRCRPYRGNGRPEAAYVIERMVDVAAAQLKMDPAELRRKNYIPPEAMPFKTSLTFTYDCGEFEKGMDLALKMADVDGFAKRKAESKKRGKLRGLGMSNTIERAAAAGLEGAEIRFDRGGTVHDLLRQHQPGPGPRDHVQAGGRRQARHPSRTTSSTSRATPTRCSSAKAPAARARPPCRARRSTAPARR